MNIWFTMARSMERITKSLPSLRFRWEKYRMEPAKRRTTANGTDICTMSTVTWAKMAFRKSAIPNTAFLARSVRPCRPDPSNGELLIQLHALPSI